MNDVQKFSILPDDQNSAMFILQEAIK
jgi:hypothetical protein